MRILSKAPVRKAAASEGSYGSVFIKGRGLRDTGCPLLAKFLLLSGSRAAVGLLDQLWDPVVVRLLNELIAIIESGDSVNVDRCKMTPEGVIYNKQVIIWDDLSYQVNYNRLTINSNSNSNVFTNLYYAETYNVHPLRYFLDWKYRKLKQETKV